MLQEYTPKISVKVSLVKFKYSQTLHQNNLTTQTAFFLYIGSGKTQTNVKEKNQPGLQDYHHAELSYLIVTPTVDDNFMQYQILGGIKL